MTSYDTAAGGRYARAKANKDRANLDYSDFNTIVYHRRDLRARIGKVIILSGFFLAAVCIIGLVGIGGLIAGKRKYQVYRAPLRGA